MVDSGKRAAERVAPAMASSTSGVLPFAPAPLQTYPYPGLNLDDSQGPRVIATSIVLMILASLAVVLRFIARHLSRAGLWWDDWTVLAALVRPFASMRVRVEVWSC